jgi:ankyrin repeat protein
LLSGNRDVCADAFDDATNAMAMHVAAYGYDHEGLLALLVWDGGGACVDMADSLGWTALHYAVDVHDQIVGLVNVFVEPPPGTTLVVAMRTTPQMPMAVDHSQSVVVAALPTAQLATVWLLLVYGANPNAQVAISGSSPLHLVARSGAMVVLDGAIATTRQA